MGESLLLVALNGLVYGLLLFMLSSGLTLIFGMMGVLNLAHASFYMLGAYLAYTISVYARVLARPGAGAPAGRRDRCGGGNATACARCIATGTWRSCCSPLAWPSSSAKSYR